MKILFYFHEKNSDTLVIAKGARQLWDRVPGAEEVENEVFGAVTFEGKAFFFEPESIEHIPWQTFQAKHLDIKYTKRTDLPTFPIWQGSVENFVQRHPDEKVVLARKTTLFLEQPIDPDALFAHIAQKKEATHFLFSTDSLSYFMGATPELLYKREGKTISSMALAGSCKDKEELLSSEKLKREWGFVKEMIEEKFQTLTSSYSWKEEKTIAAHPLFHLYQEIEGQSKASDKEIIKALHPTPAIGGFPRESALRFIKKHEPFERGYYAGLVGMMSREKATFAVAIRSALLEEKELHLFAGCGIVKGSEPLQEWEELEAKIEGFIYPK